MSLLYILLFIIFLKMSMLDSLSKEQIIRVEPVKWEPI